MREIRPVSCLNLDLTEVILMESTSMFIRSVSKTMVFGCLLGAFATLSLTAQTPGFTLASFTEESVITADQAYASNAPALPDAVVDAITGGGYELHQQLVYDSVKSTLTIKAFLVPSGSPVPVTDMSSTIPIYNYVVSVTQVTATESAIAFAGSISATNQSGSTVLSSNGLVTVATGFSLMSPDATGVAQANFTVTSVAITGVGAITANSGRGSVKILNRGAQLPIAVAGPKGQLSLAPTFQLTAAKSLDPAGGTLTYKWVFVPNGGQSIQLVGANTATPTVFINDVLNGQGDYKFQLVVTNSAGLSAVDTVTVTYATGDTVSPGREV